MIEMNLMMKILTEAMNDMSPNKLKEIVEDLNLKTTNFTSQAITVALQSAIKFSGFAAYQVALIVANSVAKAILGHGLKLATNAAVARTMGVFAGPIGWVLQVFGLLLILQQGLHIGLLSQQLFKLHFFEQS